MITVGDITNVREESGAPYFYGVPGWSKCKQWPDGSWSWRGVKAKGYYGKDSTLFLTDVVHENTTLDVEFEIGEITLDPELEEIERLRAEEEGDELKSGIYFTYYDSDLDALQNIYYDKPQKVKFSIKQSKVFWPTENVTSLGGFIISPEKLQQFYFLPSISLGTASSCVLGKDCSGVDQTPIVLTRITGETSVSINTSSTYTLEVTAANDYVAEYVSSGTVTEQHQNGCVVEWTTRGDNYLSATVTDTANGSTATKRLDVNVIAPIIINGITGDTTVEINSTTTYILDVTSENDYTAVYTTSGTIVDQSKTGCTIKWDTRGEGFVKVTVTDIVNGTTATQRLIVTVGVTDWTLNYNGVNSYVKIPEWRATRGLVSLDIYIAESADQFILDGREDSATFSNNYGMINILPDGSLYVTPDSTGVGSMQWLGTYTVNGIESGKFAVGHNTFEFEVKDNNERVKFGVTRLAQSIKGNYPFKGQISNLRLTDKDNPSNSRFYKGIIKDHFMPTSTVLVDELGDGSTNGTAINFGTTTPYVPHLEEGEGYLGDYTTSTYMNGVDLTQRRITGHSVTGKFGSIYSNKPTVGSVLSSGDTSIRLSSLPYPDDATYQFEVISGTDHEIQQGFQYPNTFRITSPAEGDKWTLNYNGVNSYVEIPEWKGREITADFYVGSLADQEYISFLGPTGTYAKLAILDGKFSGGKPRYTEVYVDGIKQTTGMTAKLGWHTFRGVIIDSRGGTLNIIGARYITQRHAKGQIINLKLIDWADESNSRSYPGIINTNSMPTSTVLVDELHADGSMNGTCSNFGTEAPWAPLKPS